MKKMSLFRQMKVAQRVVVLSEAERKAAVQEVKMDRFDIVDFLNGQNLLLITSEIEELEECDYGEIIAGLELYHHQVREQGHINEDVKFLQRESKFDAFENAVSELVAGYEVQLSKIRKMPGETLRQWIIKYIEQLARARRKTEKSNVFTCQHNGIGW